MEATSLKLNEKFINPLGETEVANTLLKRITGDRINEWPAKDCSEIVTVSDREKDVRKVIDWVAEMGVRADYNPNGSDTIECPVCRIKSAIGSLEEGSFTMKEVKHKPDCVYLIAKDLLTNLR